MKTTDVRHDEAYVTLRFLDDKKQPVHVEHGPRFRGTREWTLVRIGPAYCDHPAARFVDVELHVGPRDREEADLQGSASFDDVWIGRLPRKTVRGSRPYNVFHVGEPVELTMTLTGWNEPTVRARLELYDREGRLKLEEEHTSQFDPRRPSDPRTFTWTPKLTEPGFYRGSVKVFGKQGLIQEDNTSLVVIGPLDQLRDADTAGTEFGWSILNLNSTPHVEHLHSLLHESGVRRVKLPVWFDAANPETGTALKKLIERLNVQGIGVVGTLSPKPADTSATQSDEEFSAAQVFRQPRDQWLPAIEPVLLDLAFKVRGWQLGDDRDLGFEALPGAVERVKAVKEEFDRIEQDAMVGVAWTWSSEPPPADHASWRYLALSAVPELTADEMRLCLESAPMPGVERWLSIAALPANDYSTDDRVRDLVERVTAAKSAKSASLYFVDPFRSDTGLMERHGDPGELFLPWRTITAVLEGAEAAGSLRLPGGSENHMFLREQDAALLLSKPTPGVETAELEGARFFDMWGRAIEPRVVNGRRVVDVGPVPIAAVGIDRDTFVWDRGCKIERPQLREVFGEPQPCTLTITNTLRQPVQGKITITGPDGWQIRPRTFDISLSDGEKQNLTFDVVLPLAAETGFQLLRLDHELNGERRRQFQLYRQVQIGNNEVVLEVETRFVGGELEVEQRLINNSPRNVSFRCYLFAPNQRRMRSQVVELAPGMDVRTYRIADGESLVGKMLWLRAEEVGGDRVLSRRFVVGDDN
ncbi:MAG: NEW3 domain-containing protein [Pirellulales bacterium]